MNAGRHEIQEARKEDLKILERLEVECFADPWSPRSLESLLAGDIDLVLVARGPEAPAVGYASFRRAGDEAELLRIAVSSRARRRGVGRRLLAEGLARLAGSGVASCYLEVRRNNQAARKLYETQGFRLVGVRRGYYADGTDALLYESDLGALNSRHGDATLTERWPAS